MYRRLCIAAVVAVSLTPLILMAEGDSQAGTGIEGTISVWPSRPGPTRRDVPDTAPVGNTAFVVKKGEQTVTSFTTDAEGHFRVTLPAGRYVVVKEGPAARIGRWRFEADVVAGQFTKVNWTADSGMR